MTDKTLDDFYAFNRDCNDLHGVNFPNPYGWDGWAGALWRAARQRGYVAARRERAVIEAAKAWSKEFSRPNEHTVPEAVVLWDAVAALEKAEKGDR